MICCLERVDLIVEGFNLVRYIHELLCELLLRGAVPSILSLLLYQYKSGRNGICQTCRASWVLVINLNFYDLGARAWIRDAGALRQLSRGDAAYLIRRH